MKNTSFQVILLAVFAALAVIGVLIFAFAIGNNTNKSVGALTIWGTLDGNSFTSLLREFSDKDNSFMQVTYSQKDPLTYDSVVTQAIASGKGPDLFLLRQDYAFREADVIQAIPYSGTSYSISRSQFENTFVDVAAPFLGESGVLAVPFLADPLVLYWNKDILSTHGFAQPPQYWDQLSKMVASITKRSDAEKIVVSAISMGEYSNIENAKDILSLLILQIGGHITKYNGNRLTGALGGDSGSSIDATEKALDFYTSFADPSKNDSYTWNRSLNNSRTAFSSGAVALYIGYASENDLIKKMNPNLNFAITKVPQIRVASTSIGVARVYGLAIPRNAKNFLDSVALAYFITSTDNASSTSRLFGIPALRRDVLERMSDGNMGVFETEVIRGRSWVDPDPLATELIFQKMIEDTTSGVVPVVSDTVQYAQKQLNNIFGL